MKPSARQTGAGRRRLADILFRQGFGTRRACEALVRTGRVSHGGQICDDPEATFAVDGLRFDVDGVTWAWHEPALVMLHKPAGYECSRAPSRHPGVLTLLPAPLVTRGLQPVGRLDQDTTGLLLLTDDGPLLHRLTSPRHHVDKVYRATLRHPLPPAAAEQLLQGVTLRDDPTPARALALRMIDSHICEITLDEGRYHQVKRMFAAVGNRVEALHRSRFGPWELPPDLPPGGWCWLDAAAADPPG